MLIVPSAHESLTLADAVAYWLRVRLLPPVQGQPTYQESPRIDSLVADALGGTVMAEHSSIAPAETLGRCDGSPGQMFQIAHPPVLPRRHSETVRIVDQHTSVEWTEVEDFSRLRPDGQPLRLGLRRPASSGSGPGSGTRRHRPTARPDPAGRLDHHRDRLPLRRRRGAATSGRGR